MQQDWMTSKNQKYGKVIQVAPYIEEGEFSKYLITHEQEITETRQFGMYACHECEEGIKNEPLYWKDKKFCSWKCLKKYTEARGEE